MSRIASFILSKFSCKDRDFSSVSIEGYDADIYDRESAENERKDKNTQQRLE